MKPGLGYKASPFRVMLPSRWEPLVFHMCWWTLMLYLLGSTAFVMWGLL